MDMEHDNMEFLTGISNFQDSKAEISQLKSENSLYIQKEGLRASKTDEDLLGPFNPTSSQGSVRLQKKVLDENVPRNFGLIEREESVLSQEEYDQIAEAVKEKK